MKTLLTLMLFAVTVQAQSKIPEWWVAGGKYNWPNVFQYESTNVIALSLIELLDRYETDCYNDSTLTEGAVFRNYDTWKEFWAAYTPRGGEFMANLVRRESRWLHREATFEGFRKWLREEFTVWEGQTKGQR